MIKENIIAAINERRARIGVIGLGYVGLPLVVEFAQQGFTGLGFEVDVGKADAINAGDSYIPDVASSLVAQLVKAERLRATVDFSELKTCDAIIICVPTPLRKTKEPDISYILAAAAEIKKSLHPGTLVILESTTYPGTTDEVLLPILEETGLALDRDFLLAFSPERVDPGNPQFQTHNIPKVVGGCSEDSAEVAALLYGQIVKDVHAVSSARVAEAAKLLENTFRAVNIGMANEMARLCYALNIDTWEVIRAAATKPFGFMAFYPGPGIGGHCLIGSEMVVTKQDNDVRVSSFETLFDEQQRRNANRSFKVDDADVINRSALKALSVEMETGAPVWKDVEYIFKRQYTGDFVTLTTTDNRRLTVTDRHPLLVCEDDGRLVERLACDLKTGERVPLHVAPVPVAGGLSGAQVSSPKVDLLASLSCERLAKIKVRRKKGSWLEHATLLKACGVSREDLRSDCVSAIKYLEIEKEIGVSRDELFLTSGKGNSHSTIPATVEITTALARIVGYYLAEGCTTIENSRPRVRWTFNANETGYVKDVCETLERELGLKTSVNYSKIDCAVHVRAGSYLFGELLRVLGCGVRSTDMRVPEKLFNASLLHRLELLKGLFRGDGDVYMNARQSSSYTKNNHHYTHSNVSITVGYFSGSPLLFQQVIFMLQSLGFKPTFKKSKPYLQLKGRHQVARLRDLFTGEKRTKIDAYLLESKRITRGRTFAQAGEVTSVAVKSIERFTDTRDVYSIEVADTHTFTTSYGLYVHNCIPLDPHYLSWKARQHGFDSRFISLAEEVNSRMPEHVLSLATDALNDKRKSVNGARVLVMGVAYKKDVNDMRESPALAIIDLLTAKGAEVSYHDPFVPHLDFEDAHTKGCPEPMTSIELTDEALSTSDCVMIVTDHTQVDYERIGNLATLIVDTRNAMTTDRRKSAKAKIIRL
ncbi:MAG: nucleotide sugar dehydrogenase [Pyrinomonadaceae bacterium MAG19_C2-C3]|nr:nucleotide sugar dehydrogenase [Pyrinomonadaceae bacterium MAG19_C2-C3]